MSLKWIGSRIGLLDKYLLEYCTIRNKGSETGVALFTELHRELVKDFQSAATDKVAQGAERPTSHDLCLPDAMQSHLYEKSYGWHSGNLTMMY